ncbi:hypothetical protein TYRP_016225 [Tyrophagus putrescentiae]|nr:hypothetical protein TYRP_016225 [Tyrophagus putrescentiae]
MKRNGGVADYSECYYYSNKIWRSQFSTLPKSVRHWRDNATYHVSAGEGCSSEVFSNQPGPGITMLADHSF